MDRHILQNELVRLDILKYAQPEHLDFLMEGLINNIISKQAFFFPHQESYKNIDGRLFNFDTEALTEGGAIDIFNDMKQSLEKAGLEIINYGQTFEAKANSARPIYNFKLNNRVCNLSNVPMIPILMQGIVVRKFSKFLNKTLQNNKVKERVYFINDSCGDTQLAFLTTEQAKYINSLRLNPNDRAYKFSYWTIFKPIFQITGLIFKAIFNLIFKRKTKSA